MPHIIKTILITKAIAVDTRCESSLSDLNVIKLITIAMMQITKFVIM